MCKELVMKLGESERLNSAVTAAVIEATKAGMSKDEILAVLSRVVELIESCDGDE